MNDDQTDDQTMENEFPPSKQVGAGQDLNDAFALSNALEPEHVFDKQVRRRRRLRPNWYLLLTGIFIFSLWAAYVFWLPPWEKAFAQWVSPNTRPWRLDLDSNQRVLVRTVQFLAVGWFFYFGACIGSFFNVVAWRWPNGRGIVFGGSKCPFCNNRLGFIHNTPIIGWMWCRGKCAFCKLPIATRYLWMEVAFGLIFAVLVVREVTTGGSNLPNWTILQPGGFENTIFTPQWLLIAAYLQHAFLFASLIMLMGSTVDGLKFPWRGWAVFLALIALPTVLYPQIEFIPWDAGGGSVGEWLNRLAGEIDLWSGLGEDRTSAILTVIVGGILGGAASLATGVFLPESQNVGGFRHWTMAGTLMGCVLGWQTAVINLVAAMLVCVSSDQLLNRNRQTLTRQWLWCLIALLIIGLTHHMFWRQIANMIYA